MGLFPLGEAMAYAFARKGSMWWLLAFSFALGFGTTVAEPALVAVAGEAAKVAANGGVIAATSQAQAGYALGVRITVPVSGGVGLVVGVIRILQGWPGQDLVAGGHSGGGVITPFPAPPEKYRSEFGQGVDADFKLGELKS